MVLLFPLNLVINKFNLHKSIQASFEGIVRLVENGEREMKKEYNGCLRKIGKEVHGILDENKDIPALFIRLKKDLMVNQEDLKYTKTFFPKMREIIIPSDSIHLTHDFDYAVADILGEELDFFGYKKITTKIAK